jgi:hypothetical protein
MNAESLAIIPSCIECGECWLPADEERWCAYLTDDDEVVSYCPECAEREFGSD